MWWPITPSLWGVPHLPLTLRLAPDSTRQLTISMWPSEHEHSQVIGALPSLLITCPCLGRFHSTSDWTMDKSELTSELQSAVSPSLLALSLLLPFSIKLIPHLPGVTMLMFQWRVTMFAYQSRYGVCTSSVKCSQRLKTSHFWSSFPNRHCSLLCPLSAPSLTNIHNIKISIPHGCSYCSSDRPNVAVIML